MGLLEVVGALHFNNISFARSNVGAVEANGIPCGAFFYPPRKRAHQNFLTVLLKVGSAFEFEEILEMEEMGHET